MLSTAAFKEITTGIQPAIFRLRSDKLLCGSRKKKNGKSWGVKDV